MIQPHEGLVRLEDVERRPVETEHGIGRISMSNTVGSDAAPLTSRVSGVMIGASPRSLVDEMGRTETENACELTSQMLRYCWSELLGCWGSRRKRTSNSDQNKAPPGG